MQQTHIRTTAIAVALALAIVGCAGTDTATETSTSTTVASTTTTTLPPYDFDAVSDLMSDFVQQQGLAGAGLIVLDRDHGTVHEEYWGDFTADRVSLIASASKMLSAGVLLRLSDLGLLDLDLPIADQVDWVTDNPTITPAQLLSNSSGLVGIYQDPVYFPYLCQYLPEPTIQECGETIFTTTDDDADIIPPDTAFRYGGGQWQVAGAVAEAVSGLSWAALIDETYIEPCGLAPGSLGYGNYFSQMGNGYDYPTEFGGDPTMFDPTENPNIEAGAYATPDVFEQVLLMYLRGGECRGGERVLSPQAVDRAVTDRVREVYGGSAGPARGYGLGMWVERGTGWTNSVGAFGATPALNIEEGIAYYLVIEANEATWKSIDQALRLAIEDVMGTD